MKEIEQTEGAEKVARKCVEDLAVQFDNGGTLDLDKLQKKITSALKTASEEGRIRGLIESNQEVSRMLRQGFTYAEILEKVEAISKLKGAEL